MAAKSNKTKLSTVLYKKTSPWATTAQNNLYLELISIRPIPAENDDYKYVIENQYRHRPDLLSFDLYGTPKLWWVFVQRNMNVLKDPVYDFEPGTTIYVPKKENLKAYLGV
jgi:alpha-L-fucosidase